MLIERIFEVVFLNKHTQRKKAYVIQVDDMATARAVAEEALKAGMPDCEDYELENVYPVTRTYG